MSGNRSTFHQGKIREQRDSYSICCFKGSTCRFSQKRVVEFYISVCSRQAENEKYFRVSFKRGVESRSLF